MNLRNKPGEQPASLSSNESSLDLAIKDLYREDKKKLDNAKTIEDIAEIDPKFAEHIRSLLGIKVNDPEALQQIVRRRNSQLEPLNRIVKLWKGYLDIKENLKPEQLIAMQCKVMDQMKEHLGLFHTRLNHHPFGVDEQKANEISNNTLYNQARAIDRALNRWAIEDLKRSLSEFSEKFPKKDPVPVSRWTKGISLSSSREREILSGLDRPFERSNEIKIKGALMGGAIAFAAIGVAFYLLPAFFLGLSLTKIIGGVALSITTGVIAGGLIDNCCCNNVPNVIVPVSGTGAMPPSESRRSSSRSSGSRHRLDPSSSSTRQRAPESKRNAPQQRMPSVSGRDRSFSGTGSRSFSADGGDEHSSSFRRRN